MKKAEDLRREREEEKKKNSAFLSAKNFRSEKSVKSKEKSASIAQYYGFSLISTPVIEKQDHVKTKDLLEIDYSKQEGPEASALTIHPEEKIALLRMYLEHQMQTWTQPVMLYYEGGAIQAGKKKIAGEKAEKIDKSHKTLHLDILGTTKSIAEATLIKTAWEILKEEGFKDSMVHINSVGDRESMGRFCKELANYYRKNIELLSPHCRQVVKKDPYEVFECKDEKCQAIKENAPSSVSYLSESSREHFREVLEYLETLDIPYKIDNTLVCNKKMWSQTAFELREMESNTLLGVGMRYNSITKKVGFKKEMGAIGMTLSYKKIKALKKELDPSMKIPKVYFIQLGFDAKLKSLQVIEMLRQAGIPLAQALSKDKLGGQIQSAENSNIPYTIIMGQKEAQENTVIVRKMTTRSQETVSLSSLPDYLKKIK